MLLLRGSSSSSSSSTVFNFINFVSVSIRRTRFRERRRPHAHAHAHAHAITAYSSNLCSFSSPVTAFAGFNTLSTPTTPPPPPPPPPRPVFRPLVGLHLLSRRYTSSSSSPPSSLKSTHFPQLEQVVSGRQLPVTFFSSNTVHDQSDVGDVIPKQAGAPDQIVGEIKSIIKQTRHEAARLEQRRQFSFLFAGSSRVVATAIASNFCLMSTKFTAASATGSPSLFAEGIHSLVDLLNDCLLFFGVMRASRDADSLHPYGFSRERYAWALISGVGIFFLGGGISMYHGITGLLEPSTIGNLHYAYGALLCSLLFEGGTALVAYRQVRNSARSAGMSITQYLRHGADPSAVQILLEDTAAIIGVAISVTSIALSTYFQDAMYDACGTIAIGLLLGATAVFLIRRNLGMIVERSMPAGREMLVVKTLLKDSVVKSIHDVKSTSIGIDGARFKAEVQFDGRLVCARYLQSMDLNSELAVVREIHTAQQLKEYLQRHGEHTVDQLADEVDRIELKVKNTVPEVKHIDLEIL